MTIYLFIFKKRIDRNVLEEEISIPFILKYCEEQFGGRNSPQMLERLEEKIVALSGNWEEGSIAYQLYDKESKSALILTIVKPLMVRVHKMVGHKAFY